jgi:hypothetical protein
LISGVGGGRCHIEDAYSMNIGLGPLSVSDKILVCKTHEPSLPQLLLGCSSMIDKLGGVSFKASERPNQYVVTFGLRPSDHKRTVANAGGMHSLFTSSAPLPDDEFLKMLGKLAPALAGLSPCAPPCPAHFEDFIGHPSPSEDACDFEFTRLDFANKRTSFFTELGSVQPIAPDNDEEEESTWSDESGLRKIIVQIACEDDSLPSHNAPVMFDSDFKFHVISQEFLDETFPNLPIATTQNPGRIAIRALGPRGYHKKTVRLNRTVCLRVTLGNVKWQLPFFVVDGLLGCMIIGTDTPEKWSLQEWSKISVSAITVSDQTIHLPSISADSKYWRAGLDLISSENRDIQPHSVVYVQIRNPGIAKSSSYGAAAPGVGLVSRRRFWTPNSSGTVYATSSAYYNEYPQQVVVFNPTETVCHIHSGMNVGDFIERTGSVVDRFSTSSSTDSTSETCSGLEDPPLPDVKRAKVGPESPSPLREAALKLLDDCAISSISPYKALLHKNNNARTPASTGESSLGRTRGPSDFKEQASVDSSPAALHSWSGRSRSPKTATGLATTQSGSLNQIQCVSGKSGDAHAVTQQLGDDLSVNQASGT